MKLRYKIYLVLVVLGTTFGLGRCKRTSSPGPKLSAPTVLPSNDKEQIIVNPVKHQLILVRPAGNEVLTLPDRVSTIDIHKDGTVSVTSPQFGVEHRLFGGAHVSNTFRIAVGMDLLYYKRLDLGLGAASRIGISTPILFTQVSYNVWSNCRVGVAYGTDRFIGGTLTVRL